MNHIPSICFVKHFLVTKILRKIGEKSKYVIAQSKNIYMLKSFVRINDINLRRTPYHVSYIYIIYIHGYCFDYTIKNVKYRRYSQFLSRYKIWVKGNSTDNRIYFTTLSRCYAKIMEITVLRRRSTVARLWLCRWNILNS